MYGTLNNLIKFRPMPPESMRLQLIKSLVLPHLDYCSFMRTVIETGEKTAAAMNYAYVVRFPVKLLSPHFCKSGVLKCKNDTMNSTHEVFKFEYAITSLQDQFQMLVYAFQRK
jgi:hypothetical protein